MLVVIVAYIYRFDSGMESRNWKRTCDLLAYFDRWERRSIHTWIEIKKYFSLPPLPLFIQNKTCSFVRLPRYELNMRRVFEKYGDKKEKVAIWTDANFILAEIRWNSRLSRMDRAQNRFLLICQPFICFSTEFSFVFVADFGWFVAICDSFSRELSREANIFFLFFFFENATVKLS